MRIPALPSENSGLTQFHRHAQQQVVGSRFQRMALAEMAKPALALRLERAVPNTDGGELIPLQDL